jgi:NADH-ubiquinone oxidoreductase chain 5
MAGPTPVSALLHAATMVTAGIYLIVRMSYLFELTLFISNLMVIIGSITALLAATAGLVQYDLKKIIAYSTCSQLGYMMIACGCQQYVSAFYHLFNHAFFKALLFLAAGSVIHAISDEQDMRKMGGLIISMPVSYIVSVIGSLALIGFPFLTGYYSKDILLELVLVNYSVYSFGGYVVGILAAMATSFYSMRSIWYVYLAPYNGYKSETKGVHEPDFLMMFPMVLLSGCSVFIGYFTSDLFLGLGVTTFNNSLTVLNLVHTEAEELFYFIRLIPLIASMFSILLCLYFYAIKPELFI